VKIDYLQFTIPLDGSFVEFMQHANDEREAIAYILEAGLSSRIGAAATALEELDTAAPVKALAPYDTAIALGSRGDRLKGLMTVMYNRKSTRVDTVLIQIPGAGCQWLEGRGALTPIIGAMLDRIGRVDFAFDFATELDPEIAFSTDRRTSILRSNTGTTVYSGSIKSDRYMRCYRYAPPHPRADRLRFEFVFKSKKQARSALETYLYRSIEFGSFCRSFGIVTHEAIGSSEGDDLATVSRNPSSSEASTTMWLIEAAAPAFRRLVASGAIADPEAFLRSYFLEG
jgi:hypothetical protein